MPANPLAISRRARCLAVLVPAAALAISCPVAASPAGGSGTGRGTRPTIVLVHGAWSDASGWLPVIRGLQKNGYTVLAPSNPLRGLGADSAYLTAVLKTVKGPIVLVGHSYGGAVITNAAAGNPNVKSLVYIAAFAPDAGENARRLIAKYPGSHLADASALLPAALRTVPVPDEDGGDGGLELWLRPERYNEIMLSDRVPAATAASLAAAQRPAATGIVTEAARAAAWRTIPSWYLVATADQAIGAANERFMALRAGAHVVEVDAPHAVHVTAPRAVTDLVLEAARAAGPRIAPSANSRPVAMMAAAASISVATGTALYALTRRRETRGR
ncbi:alpha/beta fold hydrolase [Streptomyces sp. NPDC002574]|uniref:alpha/beta fold hydrolase n=1 Tax=Streptomyces sp. NPDC002574 TaxID=3364652 RepID=UPI0036D1B0E7